MHLIFPNSECFDLRQIALHQRAPIKDETLSIKGYNTEIDGDYVINHVDWNYDYQLSEMTPNIYLEKAE